MLYLNRNHMNPLDILNGNFDRLLQGVARPLFDEPTLRPFPALNVWEDGDRLMAEAELPGLRLEDIEVLVVGNELTIKGRRPTPAEIKGSVHRQERGVGEFARTITLPVEIDAEKVEATLKNGVLTVLLPKAEPAKARKIAVRETK